jgi:NTE family protein
LLPKDCDVRTPSLVAAAFSVLIRLPFGFLVPFALLAGGWIYFFKNIRDELANDLRDLYNLLHSSPRVEDILIALSIVALFLVGLLIAYNLSVLINWLIVRYGYRPRPVSKHTSYVPPPSDEQDDKLAHVDKIGIVLAGGGAKGAFQAGAMKAIYEFLADRGALQKVKVISATSIGSWNALFWLADLIAPAEGAKRSAHEEWWREIRLRYLIAPSWYWPGFRNSFFDTGPWQRQFDNLFGQGTIADKLVDSPIHFYFTRSHVRSGRLECTTNNVHAHDLPRVTFTRITSRHGKEQFLEAVRDGVFASMDLPPMFPYKEMDDEVFEDGGVIDNLPVMFAAMESCDLIFVLPLNSDFNAEPNTRSLLSRFIRVMDVRQGALERGNLKTQYLYNELAVLRKYAHELQDRLVEAKLPLPELDDREMAATLKYALDRKHNASRLFAICPQRTFVETTINTPEFWKHRAAGRAFALMYRQTNSALENHFDPKCERVEMCLVYPDELTWARDF